MAIHARAVHLVCGDRNRGNVRCGVRRKRIVCFFHEQQKRLNAENAEKINTEGAEKSRSLVVFSATSAHASANSAVKGFNTRLQSLRCWQ